MTYQEYLASLDPFSRIAHMAPQASHAAAPGNTGLLGQFADWAQDPTRPERDFAFGSAADVARGWTQGQKAPYTDLVMAGLDLMPGLDDIATKGLLAAGTAIGPVWMGRQMMARGKPRGRYGYEKGLDDVPAGGYGDYGYELADAPSMAPAARSPESIERAKALVKEYNATKDPLKREAIEAQMLEEFGGAYSAGIAANPRTGGLPPIPKQGLLGDALKRQRGVVGSDTSQLGKIGASRAQAPITALEPGVQTGQRISTANPTQIAAEKMGFHGSDEYNINSAMMRENPDAFAHNMGLMSAYMPTRKRNPEARFDDYMEYITGNLEYLAKNAPEDFVARSGNWYKGANALANDMSNSYGVPVEASAAVLARLSPGMDWLQNVEQADRLIDIWKNQKNTPMPKGPFKGKTLGEMSTSEAKADWIRQYDEATNVPHFYGLTPEGALTDIQRTKEGKPKSLMWQSNANLSRAVDMLENPSAENISRNMGLSGHKIRNFYNNIVSPFDPFDTTIDTHAVSAGLLMPYSQKGIPVGHAFGGGAVPGVVKGSSKSGMASGTYGLFGDAYRNAAQGLGIIPQALQSPTWELIRETFPTSGAQKDKLRAGMMPIFNELKRGIMTPHGARDAYLDIATKGQGLLLPEWFGR